MVTIPFFILGRAPHFYGLVFQWDADLKDPLLILEWVFLQAQPNKAVTIP